MKTLVRSCLVLFAFGAVVFACASAPPAVAPAATQGNVAPQQPSSGSESTGMSTSAAGDAGVVTRGTGGGM